MDFHDQGAFSRVVPNVPDSNYAWAIYGAVPITTAGLYTLCVTSDDGCRPTRRRRRRPARKHAPRRRAAPHTSAPGAQARGMRRACPPAAHRHLGLRLGAA